ncbi:4-hydroxy-tetrahydrodipicolinate reductase-like [Ylistrum balloti]|uniref:4-hydroxy-tetrahydrodipicolinate reductase-like n=1 Tax=Ylistrum balloti TaxID=509963 RepID=UPI002905CF39|nr:4-hydroxy-tetrahydrodipicolinate reductase-like [Ylistrum balloti]
MSINIAIAGAAGRMGQRLVSLTKTAEDLELIGAWESEGHPVIGQNGVVATMQEALQQAHVYVDFTRPEPTLKHLAYASEQGIAAVIGTTGFTKSVTELFAPFATKIPIVWAPNMSIGVNVLLKLVEDAVSALGPDFDVEVLEMHHRWKEDAPSGTAKALLRCIQAKRPTADNIVTGREGITGARSQSDIGAMTLRGGDVVGDHTVYLAGLGERLELTHRAQSRDTFALGALRAARWVAKQQPGLYDMHQVLGSKT